MKSIVEGQCGQQNALVGLANTFGTSNQRIAPSAAPGALLPSSSLGEQMANEFLQQQNRVQAPNSFSLKALSQNLPQSSSSSSLANKWSNEFQPRQNQLASQWAQQYSAPPASYESAWQVARPNAPSFMEPRQSSIDSGMWSSEFLDNIDSNLQQGSSSSQSRWADEFLDGVPDFQADTWRSNGTYEKVWEDIQNRVNEVQKEEEQINNDYRYQTENPFLSHGDPFAEGDHLMRSGDIGNAMLAYEAAVQKNPSDAQAWCRLGLSHAENERDKNAIAAFKKCLEIQPNNREALLALSVSLANEGAENDALHELDKWIAAYEGKDVSSVSARPAQYFSFLDSDAFAAVEARFLAAARKQTAPDADLQNSLGVLYNLNRNYSRAVDSIKLAIAARPDDPRLWNRLGATLANGDRTAEAISAYREALQRYPTYVRARYNLGISCMQLYTYREAIEHFVSALELQKGGNDNSIIWHTMRAAAIRCHEVPELLTAVEGRDLNRLKSSLNNFAR